MVPSVLTSNSARRVSGSCSQTCPVTRMPALFTQTSSEPPRSAVSAAAARHASASRTSSAGRERRRAELARAGLRGIGIDVGQVDGQAARRERSGDLQAQAPPRSCDQRRAHGRAAYVRLRISRRSPNTNFRLILC